MCAPSLSGWICEIAGKHWGVQEALAHRDRFGRGLILRGVNPGKGSCCQMATPGVYQEPGAIAEIHDRSSGSRWCARPIDSCVFARGGDWVGVVENDHRLVGKLRLCELEVVHDVLV